MESKASFEAHDGSFPDYLLSENQVDNEENRALFHAASSGNLAGVKAALRAGAKPNFFYHPEDHKNALHVAAENGHVEVVDVLLEHGAVVNALTAKDHATALVLAATLHNPAVVRRLIAAGADLTLANGYGNTALHESCFAGHLDTAQALLAAGAKINAVNHKGSTPLHMFCYGEPASAHPASMAVYLLDQGAAVNAADHRGATPLLVACSTGREDLVELFLSRGASAGARDSSGRGPAEVADFYRHKHIADLFRGVGKEKEDKESRGEGKSHK